MPNPMKFQDPEELQRRISEYFEECKKQEEPPTVTGLALYLDTSRMGLLNYEKEYDEEFHLIIRRAKDRIQHHLEKELISPFRKNVTGLIFNLKNNYGWVDRREVNTKVELFSQEFSELSDEELQQRITRLERALDIAGGGELLEGEIVEECD